MRKAILFFFAAALSSFVALSQTTFSDNFDQDTAGKYLAKSDPAFTTWSKSPGGTDDILVSSTKAHSGSNSIYFASTSSPGGPSDIVLPFVGGAYNTGNFSYSMWMFVNTGKKAYFNLQEQTTVGKGWSFDANFDSIGNLTFVNTLSGTLFTTTYSQNQWFQIEIRVNLNSNNWQVFIDNNLMGSFTNSYRAIASIDIYPMTGTSFYVDDVSYTYTPYTKPAVNAALTYIYNVSGYLATQAVTPKIEIRNLGTQTITSATVQTFYNGILQTKNVTGLSLAPLSYDTITMDYPITLVAGSNLFTTSVTKANGAIDNDTSDNTKSVLLNPVVPAVGKFVIGEEATGTWCGWCVRGIVFLKQFEEKYKGLFQGIAVHNADPMVYGNYDRGVAASSFPNAIVDRGAFFDPSAMETDILARLKDPPVTMIKGGAKYNSQTGVLNVSLTTTFNTAATGNYKIACVLVEDSVSGIGTGWDQHNYYSGGASGVMGGFEKLPSDIAADQIVYDHVGRIIVPNYGGLPNAFKASVNSGEIFVHNFAITMDPTWRQNKMKIVGFVINPTGRIDNGMAIGVSSAIANGWVAGTAVTGVQRLDIQTANMNVYPNPVKNDLHISLPANSNTEIQIYSISGELMQKTTKVNATDISFDTQNWASGIYLVRILNGDQVVNRKFVKE